jgi:hypothetical protein
MSRDIVSRLLQIATQRAEIAKRDSAEIIARAQALDNEYGSLGNYSFLQSAYLLGYLYSFKHPDNALYGQAWCAELATAFTDPLIEYLRAGRKKGEKAVTAEWSPLGTLELIDLLKPSGKRRAEWLEFVESYIEFASERPFGFTSPNHEAWRELFLYRAGTILDRPKLCDLSIFFCKQELNYQTPEGFWEEGKHHGPSMVYNTIMLEPLAWLYRLSGDSAIKTSVERLANFMSQWCFPDGGTCGAFDGRQTTSFGFGIPVCPGLELTPAGRTLNARNLEMYDRQRVGASVRGSAWYDHFALFFFGTAIRYFDERVPAEERKLAADPRAALSADADGVRENHTLTFDGALVRKGKWCLGLSGQNSDIAKQAPSIFRLERQSRIELWHADAGSVLGGGHNRKDWPVPYANAVLDTGFAGETSFGLIEQERDNKRRSYYLPQWSECSGKDTPELKLHFAHGTVRFSFHFDNDATFRIEAGWNVRCVKRLCLQIPLIVKRGGTLLIDGAAVSANSKCHENRSGTVKVQSPESSITLTVPKNVESRVHYPLIPLKYYIDPIMPDTCKPPFHIALVSCQWTNPAETGSAVWSCSVG